MSPTSSYAALVRDAASGRFTRRQVLARAAALGLSAPAIAALLAACGGSAAAPTTAPAATSAPAGTPASRAPVSAAGTPAASPVASASPAAASGGTRGDSGVLKIVMAQATTILNPALASGYKDWYASQFVLEPLADFDPDGNLYPVLAAEIPSQANGGLSSDGTSVTWKLKSGVVWSDGTPFTADDVKFTYAYTTNPATAATTAGSYTGITAVDVVDPMTIKVTFKEPTPGWYLAFCGYTGLILPQHILSTYVGANAKNAPFNLQPTGTGPFVVTEFKPGDTITLTANAKYRDPNLPRFASINVAGGVDALSAARAVIQTGEADYAWGAVIPAALYSQMQNGQYGKLITSPPAAGVERIAINMTDPNQTVDGQQSHLGTPHPFQSNLAVRQAYALAVPRDQIASSVYGPTAKPAVNVLNGPPKYVSKNTTWKYDLAAAGKLLDDAGWVKGSDGVRAKGGVKMQITYQTSILTQRQQVQEVVKSSFAQLGITVNLKTVQASVFFGSGASNTDTYPHFYADIETYYIGPSAPYPLSYMAQFYGKPSNIAQRENNWAGLNITRWQNSEFDAAYEQAAVELDPAKQADLFIKMNDLVVNDVAVIPEYVADGYIPVAHTLGGVQALPWTGSFAQVAQWYRIKS